MKSRDILILVLVLGLCGCDQLVAPFRKKPAPPKPVVPIVQDEDLAKLILKPVKKDLVLNTDPFKPLFNAGSGKKKGAAVADSDAEAYAPSLGKVNFLGVTVVEGEYVALIVSDKAKGAFRVDDYIKDFKVESIQSNRVVLSNGSQLLTLKRGE